MFHIFSTFVALTVFGCLVTSLTISTRSQCTFIKFKSYRKSSATQRFLQRQDFTASETTTIESPFITTTLWLPTLFSLPLPFIIHEISDYNTSTFTRQLYIITLLLFKRIYLYLVSFIILDTASKKSSKNYKTGLGERLLAVNQEILPSSVFDPFELSNKTITEISDTTTATTNTNSMSEETKEFYSTFDNIDQKSLALALPIFLTLSLGFSYFLLTQLTTSVSVSSDSAAVDSVLTDTIRNFLLLASNFMVCVLFVKNLISPSSQSKVTTDSTNSINQSFPIYTAFAILLTLISFAVPPGGGSGSGLNDMGQYLWPLHNFINACLCITVSRVLQLNSLSTVALALTGLTAYDVIATAGTQMYSDNGNSVMEAVAVAKLGLSKVVESTASSSSSSSSLTATTGIGSSTSDTAHSAAASNQLFNIKEYLSSTLLNNFPNSVNVFMNDHLKWRPGLVEVAVRGRVTDALGLGDVVFPAILSSWALRYDMARNKLKSLKVSSTTTAVTVASAVSTKREASSSQGESVEDEFKMYKSSLVGYVTGCILCDLTMASGLSGTGGLPALLYLTPSMLAAVAVTGVRHGEWTDMLRFNSTDDSILPAECSEV